MLLHFTDNLDKQGTCMVNLGNLRKLTHVLGDVGDGWWVSPLSLQHRVRNKCANGRLVHQPPSVSSEPPQPQPYLSFLESSVDIFILLVLFQLRFHQHLTDVHDLLHRQSQAFHWVTELLLEAKGKVLLQSQKASSRLQPKQPATWLVAPETEGFSLQTGVAVALSWASQEFLTVGDCV